MKLEYSLSTRERHKRTRDGPPAPEFTPITTSTPTDDKYQAILEALRTPLSTSSLHIDDEPDPTDIPPPIKSSVESPNVRWLRAIKRDIILTHKATPPMLPLDLAPIDAMITDTITDEMVARTEKLVEFIETAMAQHRYDLVYKASRQQHPPTLAKVTPVSVRKSLVKHYADLLRDPTPIYGRTNVRLPHGPLEDPPTRTSGDNEVEVFTDGSVPDGGGQATWGVHCPALNVHACGMVPTDIFGATNSNDPVHSLAAEAWAILQATLLLPLVRIRIITDNQGCWRRVENLQELEKTNFEGIEVGNVWRLVAANTRNTHLVATWVRGHGGDEGNRCADSLTNLAYLLDASTRHLIVPPTPTWTTGITEEQLRTFVPGVMTTWPRTTLPLANTTDSPPLPPRKGDDSTPTAVEVYRAICKLRNSARGEDGISAETIKNPLFFKDILDFIQHVWKNVTIPRRWTRSIMSSIPKTSAPMGPANCRGISVTNVMSKILANVILSRHSPAILPQQFGSQRARGCPQAVHVVKSVIRGMRDGRTSGCLLFVDVKKAFDSVARYHLPAMLASYGFGPTTCSLINQLWKDEIVLRFPDDTFSSPIFPSRGIKQGCVLSPTIFSLCMDVVLTDLQTRVPGIQCYNPSTNQMVDIRFIAYVDDLVLFADTASQAETALKHLQSALKMVGLEINTSKTEYMHINESPLPTQLSASGYDAACRSRGSHESQYPDSTNASINLHDLRVCISSVAHPSRCVFADCPHVIRPNAHPRGVADAITAHLSQRHSLKVTTSVTNQGYPPSTTYDPKHLHPQHVEERRNADSAGESHVWFDGAPISRVFKVKYLGSILTPDGSDISDVQTRMSAAHKAFYSVPIEVWKSPRLMNKQKATLYECLVLPALLYGAGSWTLTDRSRSLLTKTHTSHLRIMLNLPTFPYLQNDAMDFRQFSYDKIIDHCGVPHILASARSERLRLFGQLQRAQGSWLGSVAMLTRTPMSPGHAGPHITSWWEVICDDISLCAIDPKDTIHPHKWANAVRDSLLLPV